MPYADGLKNGESLILALVLRKQPSLVQSHHAGGDTIVLAAARCFKE
jgi:hypothetical protein